MVSRKLHNIYACYTNARNIHICPIRSSHAFDKLLVVLIFTDNRLEILFRDKMTRSTVSFEQTYSLLSEFPRTLETAWTRSEIECGILCQKVLNCNHYRYDNAVGGLNCLLLE